MTDNHHVPTLAELSEARRVRDAEERRNRERRDAVTVPPQNYDHVDPRATLTSTEVVSMELHDHGEQPYVLESSTFETLLNARRSVALRIMADLDVDIERLQMEIAQRTARRNDLAQIVQRADAALGLTPLLDDQHRT
jgi:hypothetical protein